MVQLYSDLLFEIRKSHPSPEIFNMIKVEFIIK